MKFPVFLCALFIFSLPVLAQAPDPAPSTPVETVSLAAFEPTREEAVLEAYIDGVVEAHMREHNIPGVTVSAVKDGRILFAKGYGLADAASGKPVSGQETLFRIGSVSKTFIWTAAMMLVERGLIDLDADVNEYLTGVVIPDAFDAPVTMNHLMAHRAGFEDTFGVFTVSDDSDRSLGDVLNQHMPKRVFPPGARTSYSNWGSALAAKIVGDVAGVSYEQFLQDEVLTPMAMTKTTLKGPSVMPAGLREKLAAGHKMEKGALVAAEPMQIGAYASAGAMASSADDMARWMLLHLGRGAHDGVRLMSPETHALMWTRRFSDRPLGADLAHGFFTRTYRGYDVYGHGGGTAAFFTYMQLVPELGFGVFVSQNAGMDRTLVGQLPDLIINRLAAADHKYGETQSSDALAEAAKDYAGAYLLNRRSFSQFEKLFALSATAIIAPGKGGALTVTAQDEVKQFLPLKGADGVYQDRAGNRIVFSRDENGAVTHFTGEAGVHSFEKTGLFDNPNTFNMALGVAALFSLTTWLGAWRRQGRQLNRNKIGAALNLFGLLGAAAFFALVGMVVALTVTLSNATASDLLNYPPASVVWLRLIALVVFLFAQHRAGLDLFGVEPLAQTPLHFFRAGAGVFRDAAGLLARDFFCDGLKRFRRNFPQPSTGP